jgi:hypothetical protein
LKLPDRVNQAVLAAVKRTTSPKDFTLTLRSQMPGCD